MAQHLSIFFLLSTLALLFPISSLGNTLALPPDDLTNIHELVIQGSYTCPTTSGPPYTGGYFGVYGVNAIVICDGLTGTPHQFEAITDTSGHFSVHVTGLNEQALELKPDQRISCDVTITFPVTDTTCRTLPSTGTLRAPAIFDHVTDNDGTLGGLLAMCKIGPFQYTG